MNPNIATLDEAAQVLAKEINGEDVAFSVREDVWRHAGCQPSPHRYGVSIHGMWILPRDGIQCELFQSSDLTQCVEAALVWYRANRKAVTAC